MMDLPPPQTPQPTTVEVRKANQNQGLRQKIKRLCEATIAGFKQYGEIELCDLNGRAYFIDVCNASNTDEIFTYRAAHWLLDGCQDSLEPRPVSDYGINPEFLKYHITTKDIFDLLHFIKDSTGKGSEGARKVPDVAYDNDAFRAIYTIMLKNPDFTPEFTTFTFGGTMADMPPLRDKDGNPNMEFFRAWQDRTEQFFKSGKK